MTHTQRALELTSRHHERGHEAYALHLRAQIEAHQEPAEVKNADTDYRQALAMAEQHGMRPLIAHCHLGLTRLYQGSEERQEAQEHLAIATTIYREMGMTYWLEKTAETSA